jgi:hypothetical protein
MPIFDVGGEKQTLFMLPMQKSLWLAGIPDDRT